ncbi:PREDICTED: taste receptor type 2 member 16 [Chinchilla lanigera]|uniref:taste receptor type 2 member 16 n=1 Tax=Chinchilla lanigera TaxID=34839 RepID=UPI00038ED231|nr:PREDICTED: taste receptor type 2 member 16 [Chinchilla lanigera]
MVLRQLTIIFIIIYAFESLTIMAQSSFTVAVLGREWMQVKRWSPVEMILTSLSICRFCLQWTSMMYNFCFHFNHDYVLLHLGNIWEFTNILTFWLTSLLAVFYCVKISCITHPIFLWLRWRILRLVPWLLLGALVISCVAIIPSVIRSHIQIQLAPLEHILTNSTLIERLKMFEQYFFRAHKMIMMTIPFFLFLICTIFLMASLIQHWEQMQQHNTGHSNASLKAHSTALKSLVVFFACFAAYFLTVVLTFAGIKPMREPWFWAWEAIIYAIVSIHSTSLMLSSPTLKKTIRMRCGGLESA